jgi:hypothetical protein
LLPSFAVRVGAAVLPIFAERLFASIPCLNHV